MSRRRPAPPRGLRRFLRNEDGAALVEFALLLPSMLLILALSVEGARTFWSYQTTITGVRDAARYLSRVVPRDVCETGGGLSGWDDTLTRIVRETQGGDSLFPAGVTVERVRSALTCRSGPYRMGGAAVAGVTADLTIDYPFAGLFTLVGIDLTRIETIITDETRILGS